MPRRTRAPRNPLLSLLTLLTVCTAFAGAVVLAAPSSAQTTPNAVSIQLVDAPTSRKDDPRAHIYIVDHLRPGDRIVRHVAIGNGTDRALAMEVYAAGATIKDGQWAVADGRTANELASWTTVTPGTLVVPARGTAQATVTVTIPDDVVEGERYAVVWTQPPSSGGQVPVVNRVGVRMYVSVGEGSEPITDFRIDNLVAARDGDGRPVVRTTVTNTGRRAIDLSGSLELTDGPGSLSAGPFPVDVGTTLAPGESAPAQVRLDPELPNGPWKATATITSGQETRKAQATISFPSGAGVASDPVPAEAVKRQRRILIPVAVALVLGLLIAILVVARRQRRDREPLPAT
jgi:hypothetical protein